MRRLSLFTALATLLIASVALANPNRDAEAEARSWLRPCQERERMRELFCLQQQSNFIEQYVWAKSGDLLAMGSTSASFRPSWRLDDKEGTDRLGLPQDIVQGCAWLLVRINRSAARDKPGLQRAFDAVCGPLSIADSNRVTARARLLLDELATHPARTPSLDWEPAPPPPKRP